MPPGPPVLATLLAEIYGPDSETRRAVVGELKKIFASVPYIVDIDDSIGEPRPRLRISIDQDRLEFFGVEQRDVYDTLQALLGGISVGYSHRGEGRNPIEIAVRLPKRDLAWSETLASTPVPANALPGNRTVVELGDVVRVTKEEGSPIIFRRDGHFADMVMAELAGSLRGADLRHARGGAPGRHHGRPLVVCRTVHGDVHDRLHRTCRHYRAQLHPAGRLHPAWEAARQVAAPSASGSWSRAL